MDNSQNTQKNSTNNLIEPPKGIDLEIESSTILKDEDVEWIEVTDDEGCGEQEMEQNVRQLQKQVNYCHYYVMTILVHDHSKEKIFIFSP